MPRTKNILLVAMAIIIALLAGVIIGSHRPAQKVTIFNRPADKTTSTKIVPEDIAGVYEYEFAGLVKGLDLRKDGTGMSYQRQKYSTAEYGRQIFNWTMMDGAVVINGKKLKPDSGDLVDYSNIRWERLRY